MSPRQALAALRRYNVAHDKHCPLPLWTFILLLIIPKALRKTAGASRSNLLIFRVSDSSREN